MQRLRPRSDIYDLYWYFAAERQSIFEKRAVGLPQPWSDDPILSLYKFCNVFRASDRVSQYLIREVIYSDPEASPQDTLLRIVLFRIFSRPETWEGVVSYLGQQPTISDLASGQLERALDHTLQDQGRLYTGAFILCANRSYGHQQKFRNHLALLTHIFIKDRLANRLLAASRLGDIYDFLHAYPLIGDFMAYQLAIDLNYSPYINFHENSFTKAGPGALRGIKKVFERLGNHSPEDAIMYMVKRQDQEFERFGLTFNGLGGRKLHAIDCQGLFCEVDKYCRVAAPELTSARTKIKAKYRQNPTPIEYFYPPKWGINRLSPTGNPGINMSGRRQTNKESAPSDWMR